MFTPDGDADGFRVALASGGRPPALLMRADDHADELPTPGGQFIGVARRPYRHHHRPPRPGRHPAPVNRRSYRSPLRRPGDRCGDKALLEFVQALAPTTADDVAAIRDLLETFGTGVDDDTAVLAFNVPRSAGGEQT